MGSALFKNDLLTAHEQGTPGGETPPSTAGETPAATEAQFMERNVFQRLDTYWDHEPRTPGGGTPPLWQARRPPLQRQGSWRRSKHDERLGMGQA
jgi:hypothetical protein